MKLFRYCFVLAIVLLYVEQPAPAQTPTSQDVRHGIAQLEQILEDRPDMRGVFPPGSPVNVWIEDAFARSADRRVYWDNREPISGQPSQYTGPANGAPASIRISDKADVSPLDKYSNLIVQLHTAKKIGEMHELSHLASSGKLNAQEFSEQMVLVYFRAVLETQAFFKANRFEKLATDRDTFTNGVLNTQSDAEAYLKQVRALPPGESNQLMRLKDLYEALPKLQQASP